MSSGAEIPGEGDGAVPGEGAMPGTKDEARLTDGVKMTSFAERKYLKERRRKRLGSTLSRLGTTPAGQQDPAGSEGEAVGRAGPEWLQLRQRLEEKRKEIQAQIKAMETLSARQWQSLGKRAFQDLMKLVGLQENEIPMGGQGAEPSMDKDTRRSIAGRAEEQHEPRDGGPGGKATEGEASDYESTMGELNDNLIAVQSQLALLSSRPPPPSDTEHEAGQRGGETDLQTPRAALDQRRTSEAARGRHAASAEASEPLSAGGGLSAREGAETHELQGPGRRKPNGNLGTGEWKLPENDRRAAEESEVDPSTRRRTLFLQRQQRRAEEVKLRRCQQEAALKCKREAGRQIVKEERLQREDSRPKLDTTPAKVKSSSKPGRTPNKLPDAAVAGLRAQELQAEVVGAAYLTPRRTIPEEKDSARIPASTPPPVEQIGLKLFKEPSAKSNRLILHNALSYCCLAGKANGAQRNQVIEELMKCEQNQCLILFRDYQCQFRALYSFCLETEEIQRLWGIGPKLVTREMIECLYKYNSDRKQFHVIPSKTMSASVDALTIHGHLWQGRKKAALGFVHK